jgi:predicted transposase YbfD/YdcC
MEMKVTRDLDVNQYLFTCFLSIEDPRVEGRVKHPLINIIFIVLCGLISGCDTWKAIELFGREKKKWLSQFLDLSFGIPTHYTLARVFELIDPGEFEKCLELWINCIVNLVSGDIISIDGKTQRGSSHVQGNKKANHIVSAYSAKEEVVIGNVKTPSKTNEIKAIPMLLKKLDIHSKIITIDAMGTQKGVANLIREKQGNYVLALKENHKRFHRKVRRLFKCAEEYHYKGMVYRKNQTKDYGHGRIEEREYTVLPMMYLPKFKKEWRDLQVFTQLRSTRHLANGKIEKSTRYYISSLPLKSFERICFAIREHWQIENGLNYKLDVGLHEDDCPIYRGHAAENLGYMRKIVLKLLNDETSCSDGVAVKRIKAALSTRYLRKVIGF